MKNPSSVSDLLPDGTTPADGRDYWASPGDVPSPVALSDAECWALATTAAVGRIGFVRAGVLDIFPVNYLVMDDHVYFRTSADGTIATSDLDHAAFQVDQIDQESRSGWTILFNGPVGRVEDSDLLTKLWGKALDEPWAPGQRDLFLRLTPTLVRGRRIGISH